MAFDDSKLIYILKASEHIFNKENQFKDIRKSGLNIRKNFYHENV